MLRRTDNETLDRRRNQARSANRRNVEYVSVTNVSKDGQMTSSQFKMDDSKMGETRIDELSGKDIKRKLIRAMQEVFHIENICLLYLFIIFFVIYRAVFYISSWISNLWHILLKELFLTPQKILVEIFWFEQS